ncbi:MAG: hypothetical protein ACJ748_00495 [Flavisolibacter sp.]
MLHSQEYLKREFIHYISDTLALLGADQQLVEKVRQVEEKPLTQEIVQEIRGFNMKQIDDVKTRLALLNTSGVNVVH